MKKTHNDTLAPKNQKQVELADIFRRYADDYRRSHALSYEQLKVMRHMLDLPHRIDVDIDSISPGEIRGTLPDE